MNSFRKNAKALLSDESLMEIYLLGIRVYRVFWKDEKHVKEKALFGIYKKLLENQTTKYYVLGFRIARVTPECFSTFGFKCMHTRDCYKLTFCGIPIVTRQIRGAFNYTSALTKLHNSRNAYKNIVRCIHGARIEVENRLSRTEEKLYQRMWFPSKVATLHQKVFPQFKNIHVGEDIVIVGCGPTMHDYVPIRRAKHISLNRALRCTRIKFDYAFIWDVIGLMRGGDNVAEDFSNYDCIKFCGKFLHEHSGFPSEMLCNKGKLYRCYSSARWRTGLPVVDSVIHEDISVYPLADFMSISFAALHFALWTHPKRIFLVGLDTVENGSFDGRQNVYHFNDMLEGYLLFQKFISLHYSEIEIISVNPIGLRGMFRDVYTESFLEQSVDIRDPEILRS